MHKLNSQWTKELAADAAVADAAEAAAAAPHHVGAEELLRHDKLAEDPSAGSVYTSLCARNWLYYTMEVISAAQAYAEMDHALPRDGLELTTELRDSLEARLTDSIREYYRFLSRSMGSSPYQDLPDLSRELPPWRERGAAAARSSPNGSKLWSLLRSAPTSLKGCFESDHTLFEVAKELWDTNLVKGAECASKSFGASNLMKWIGSLSLDKLNFASKDVGAELRPHFFYQVVIDKIQNKSRPRVDEVADRNFSHRLERPTV